jgi:hypothetical protein
MMFLGQSAKMKAYLERFLIVGENTIVKTSVTLSVIMLNLKLNPNYEKSLWSIFPYVTSLCSKSTS